MTEEQVYNLTHGIESTPENLILLGRGDLIIEELNKLKEALRAERERGKKLDEVVFRLMAYLDEDETKEAERWMREAFSKLLSRKDSDG